MRFAMVHNNFNVTDLPRSVAFYREALGLFPVREIAPKDGSFKIVFLEDGTGGHQLELTWVREHPEAYNLGENEFHLAFAADDFAAAHAFHKGMGCVCHENEAMGLYFISDPDGYWLEIVPAKPAR